MDILDKFWKAVARVQYVLPEIISLVANIADIFLDSTLKLYIVESACKSMYSEQECKHIKYDQEKNAGVQKLAASYMMWNNVILALPVLLILPICGSWSDSTNRRHPIILCAAACSVAAIIFWVNAITPGEDLYMILVGTLFRAIACRISVITMVVSSLIADNTTPEDRTKRISYLLSMRYIGIIIGLTTQGILLTDNMFSQIFMLDTFLFLFIVLIAMFFLKDKRSCDTDNKTDALGRKTHLHLWESIKLLWHKPGRGSLLQMWIIFTVLMIDRAAKNADYEVSILYMGKKMPHFTNSDFSWFRTTETICCALISTVGGHFLFKGGRDREIPIAIIVVFLRIVRMVIFAFTDNAVAFYIANTLGTPITLMVSTCRSLLSQVVLEDDVGKAFSMASCLEILANMFGSILTLRLYTETSKLFTGTVYLFIGFLYFIIMVLLITLNRLNSPR